LFSESEIAPDLRLLMERWPNLFVELRRQSLKWCGDGEKETLNSYRHYSLDLTNRNCYNMLSGGECL